MVLALLWAPDRAHPQEGRTVRRVIDLAHGGLAGLLGLLLMTGAILAGRPGRLFRDVPPAEITARAEEQTGFVPGPYLVSDLAPGPPRIRI